VTLGIKELAALLGVHHRTALRMVHRKEIKAFRAGPKLWRVTRQSYEAYIREREEMERHFRPVAA